MYDDCIDGQLSYKDPSLLLKFDSLDFTKEMYKLMTGWTMDDLNVFKKYFVETLQVKVGEIQTEYEKTCKFPRLKGIKTTCSVEELASKLLEISSVFSSNQLNAKAILWAFDGIELDASLDGFARLDTAFKLASKKLIAHYSITSYVEWMKYITSIVASQTKESDDLLDGLPVAEDSTREAKLTKLFSYFPNDSLSETQIGDLVKNILESSQSFMNLKIQKGIVEWKKESELQSYETPKQEHIQRLLDILQDVMDDDFEDFISLLDNIYSSLPSSDIKDSDDSSQKDKNKDSQHEFNRALKHIRSLKTKTDLNIASACKIALDVLCSTLETLHPNHIIQGTISLIENSATKLDNGHSLNEEFLRYVATSKELEVDFLGSCASEDSIDNEILKLKELNISDSKTENRYSKDVRFQTSPGSPSSTLSFHGLTLLSKTDKIIGTAAFKLQGESHLLESLDLEFLKVSFLYISLIRIEWTQ